AGAADKGDALLEASTRHVLRQQRLLATQPYRIISPIMPTGFPRLLPVTYAPFVPFPGREVLMLGTPRVTDIGICVIHHRATLIIAAVLKLLEIKGAVSKPAELVVEVTVERPGIKHV